MKAFNKQEFNILCALALGWVQEDNGFKNGDLFTPTSYLKFDTNWSDLMLVKERICTLDSVEEFNVLCENGKFSATILPAHRGAFSIIYVSHKRTELAATCEAIWMFFLKTKLK